MGLMSSKRGSKSCAALAYFASSGLISAPSSTRSSVSRSVAAGVVLVPGDPLAAGADAATECVGARVALVPFLDVHALVTPAEVIAVATPSRRNCRRSIGVLQELAQRIN